jgi:hypothetical protein
VALSAPTLATGGRFVPAWHMPTFAIDPAISSSSDRAAHVSNAAML